MSPHSFNLKIEQNQGEACPMAAHFNFDISAILTTATSPGSLMILVRAPQTQSTRRHIIRHQSFHDFVDRTEARWGHY